MGALASHNHRSEPVFPHPLKSSHGHRHSVIIVEILPTSYRSQKLPSELEESKESEAPGVPALVSRGRCGREIGRGRCERPAILRITPKNAGKRITERSRISYFSVFVPALNENDVQHTFCVCYAAPCTLQRTAVSAAATKVLISRQFPSVSVSATKCKLISNNTFLSVMPFGRAGRLENRHHKPQHAQRILKDAFWPL